MALVKTSRITANGKPHLKSPSVKIPRKRVASQVQPQAQHAKAAERIAAATEELAAGITEAAAAAIELRSAMAQIAAGAEEAAGAAQSQHAAIRSIAANLDNARSEADLCDRRTSNVELVLVEAAGQINIAVRAIEQSATRQQANVEVIEELARRAEAIGDITLTVSRISDQTNLLALNAAIEAARAGDQGRGFAVVAEEVRKLAEESQHAAEEISQLIAAIQSQTGRAVEVVESGAARTQDGAAVVEETREAFLKIGTAVDEVSNRIEQIAAASQEIAATAQSMQDNITEVAVVAEESSASTEQVSA